MSEAQPTTQAAPGWYPVDANTVRYWDGQSWSEVTAPVWRPPVKDSARRAITVFVIIVVVLVGLALAGAAVNDTGDQGKCDAYSSC